MKKRKILERLFAGILAALLITLSMPMSLFAAAAQTEEPLAVAESLVGLKDFYHGSTVVTDDSLTDDTLGVRGSGYGNPITLHFYYKEDRQYEGSGIGKTGDVVILYVINTETTRYGKDSDETILRSLLDRNFYVIVLDYAKNPVVSPDLDFSIQAVRTKIIDGTIKTPNRTLDTQADAALNYVLPAGYNITYGIPYFAYDLHGAAGTLELIVDIWNNDCKSVKRDSILYWLDADGKHKATKPYDPADSRYYSQNDIPDENGRYKDYGIWFKTADGSDGGITNAALAEMIEKDEEEAAAYCYTYMGNTYAEDIYDCVKPDGTFIDLVLRMDVIYPTGAEDTPVMISFSSGYTRVSNWTSERRPQLTGFLFSGYTGVVSDYGCVPMCRNDHYGYLTGTDAAYAVSGDNYTYSLSVYNGVRSDTALLRTLRALGTVGIDYGDMTDPRDTVLDGSTRLQYSFDINAVAGYGNSKGGAVIRLGAEHPELLEEIRQIEGHVGETRYDLLNDPTYATGKKDADGETVSVYKDPFIGDGVTDAAGRRLVRDPTEQPFKTGDTYTYDSGLDLVYAQCGACAETILSGHAPIFATGTQTNANGGGSYTAFYREVMTRSRAGNVPFYGLVSSRLGHTYGYGEDRDWGIDTYYAFHRYANYWLQNGDPTCEIIDVDTDNDIGVAADVELDRVFEIGVDQSIKFAFIGSIPGGDNIGKIEIRNALTGVSVTGAWTSAYGGQQWYFTPYDIEDGAYYLITVPTTVTDARGNSLSEEKTLLFSTSQGTTQATLSDMGAETVTDTDAAYMIFADEDYSASKKTSLRFAVRDTAANTVLIGGATLAAGESVSDVTAWEALGEVTVSHAGIYTLDVTDFLSRATGRPVFRFLCREKAGDGETSAVVMDRLSSPLSSVNAAYATDGVLLDYIAVADIASPEGADEKMLKLYGETRISSWIDLYGHLSGNYVVSTTRPLLRLKNIISSEPLTEADIGRTFRVSFDLYDETSRLFYAVVQSSSSASLDFAQTVKAFRTEKGWNHVNFEVTVSDAATLDALNANQLYLYAENKSAVTLPTNVLTSCNSYTLSTQKKAAYQAGVCGMTSGYYKWYDNSQIAYEQGVVTVNAAHSHALYIGDITATEIFTGVGLTAASLTLSLQSLSTLTPEAFVSVGSDGTAEESLTVSGGVRDKDIVSRKVYLKLSLADHAIGDTARFAFLAEGENLLSVYGVADAAAGASLDPSALTADTAPANDLYSGGVRLAETYQGQPLATFAVSAEKATYTVDISAYADAMKSAGADAMTLILVAEAPTDGDGGETVITPVTTGGVKIGGLDFATTFFSLGSNPHDRYIANSGFNWQQDVKGSKPVTVDGTKTLRYSPYAENTFIRFTGIFGGTDAEQTGSGVHKIWTEADIGRSFTVTVLVKTSADLTLNYGMMRPYCAMAKGNGSWGGYYSDDASPDDKNYAQEFYKTGGSTALRASDGWQTLTYTFTVDETMLPKKILNSGDTTQVEQAAISYFGVRVTDYDFTGCVSEKTDGRPSLYFKSITVEERVTVSRDVNETDYCGNINNTKLENSNGYDRYIANAGFEWWANVKNGVTVDGRNYIRFSPFAEYTYLRYTGLFGTDPSEQTDYKIHRIWTKADVGKTFTVTFRAKSDRRLTMSYGLMRLYNAQKTAVNGYYSDDEDPDDKNYAANFYGTEGEAIFRLTDTWYTFTYTFTVDETMLPKRILSDEGEALAEAAISYFGVKVTEYDFTGCASGTTEGRPNITIGDFTVREIADGFVGSTERLSGTACVTQGTATDALTVKAGADMPEKESAIRTAVTYRLPATTAAEKAQLSLFFKEASGERLKLYAAVGEVAALPRFDAFDTPIAVFDAQSGRNLIDVTAFVNQNLDKTVTFLLVSDTVGDRVTIDGTQTPTLNLRSDAVTEFDIAAFKVRSNLTLASDLRYNLYIPKLDVVKEITLDGAVQKLYDLPTREENGVTYYVVTKAFAAKNAADTVTAEVLIDTGAKKQTATYAFSIPAYAGKIVNGSYDDKTKTLMKDMLAYIDAAMTYFGTATTEKQTAITDVIGTDYALPDDADVGLAEKDIVFKKDGDAVESAALLLEDAPAFVFYLKEGKEDLADSFVFRSADGAPLKVEKRVESGENGRTYLVVTTYAYGMNDTLTFTYTGGNGSYNLAKYHSGTDASNTDLKTLTVRLAKYANSAKAYKAAAESAR